MDTIASLFRSEPLIALFLTIAVGYFVGKFKVGTFVLGGIAGTLLVGVAIGQIGVQIDAGIKSIFFALFIYAVGYQGGPQFFQALNLKSLSELVSAFFMTLMGLLCVLVAAWLFELDRGTAAGLAAGGLTQSAILGTAGDAISRLPVSPEVARIMQTNVAVGYAVCYIFGSLGPILMITWFFPTVMKWDIRKAAVAYAQKMSGGTAELEPGQFNAATRTHTRFYRVGEQDKAAGKTALEIDGDLRDAAVEAVIRGGERLDLSDRTRVEAGDVVAVTGLIQAIKSASGYFGAEVVPPAGFELVEENRDITLTNKKIDGRQLGDLDDVDVAKRHGIFVMAVRRMGHHLPLLPQLKLRRGDEVRLLGRPRDLDRVTSRVGVVISAAAVTDFVFLGIGMVVGMLIGSVQFHLAGVPVTIGSGVGCLLSGLLFGWLRSVHPRVAAMPRGATNFLRDFGLAAFVGIVGLNAGKQALVTVQEHGLTLLFLGVGVTIVPQLLAFFFSYYILRIQNPIDALACTAGGRSANPAFAALLSKAGNGTPVVPFTVTYAVANVFLTLWGPLIVGLVTKNAVPPQ